MIQSSMIQFLLLLCVLCASVANAQAPADSLSAEESKKLDALTETWNRLRAPIEELERKPEIQRYLALLQLRAELQRDLESFAQKAVAERRYKPGEAFLDLNARRVVKAPTAASRSAVGSKQ